MSYGQILAIPKGTEPHVAKKMVADMDIPATSPETLAEQEKAVQGAKTAVIALLGGHSAGEVKHHAWRVTICGHANPLNRRTGASAADYITLTLAQDEPISK